jgi:hypothetical protein
MALGAAVLSGCAAPAVGPVPSVPAGPVLRVSDAAAPLSYSDGARAKRLANGICGPRGVRSSTGDRFDNGTWVFVEGCA